MLGKRGKSLYYFRKDSGIEIDCAAARIPLVVCNISRGGPGVGVIQPAQMDYNEATKAAGSGGFRMIVLAPSTVQEAADLTYKAFDLADRDRNPVMILGDGVLGTIMEPAVLPPMRTQEEVAAFKKAKTWAVNGHELDYANRGWIMPGTWSTDIMEEMNNDSAAMYERWQREDVMVEEFMTEDAELIIASYGISGRIAKSAVRRLRKAGKKVGMIRPITVSPFPYDAFDRIDYGRCRAVLVTEMSIPAQMAEDVDHAVARRCPVERCLKSGGNILTAEDVVRAAEALYESGR